MMFLSRLLLCCSALLLVVINNAVVVLTASASSSGFSSSLPLIDRLLGISSTSSRMRLWGLSSSTDDSNNHDSSSSRIFIFRRWRGGGGGGDQHGNSMVDSTSRASSVTTTKMMTTSLPTATTTRRRSWWSVDRLVSSIPRGGKLFGNSKAATKNKPSVSTTLPTDSSGDGGGFGSPKKYPPMTRNEIEDWLEHVPVFAVTDANGAGVAVFTQKASSSASTSTSSSTTSTDDSSTETDEGVQDATSGNETTTSTTSTPPATTAAFYFFLNPVQANMTLQQLKSNNNTSNMDLKISAFSLGKIWFHLLNNESSTGGSEAILKDPTSVLGSTGAAAGSGDGDSSDSSGATSTDTTSSSTAKSSIEYRLVPDSRDLLGARMLLTMSPDDGEKLKQGGQMTPEMAQAAIQRAMKESPKFQNTYNEIPVFTIAQMRMQRRPAEDEAGGATAGANDDDEETVTLLPMYFSLQNMVGTWQQFMSQAPANIKDVEPSINLLSLQDMITLMQQESTIDWRHVVLVPPVVPGANGGGVLDPTGSASSAAAAAATSGIPSNPMAQMGGATLGDD